MVHAHSGHIMRHLYSTPNSKRVDSFGDDWIDLRYPGDERPAFEDHIGTNSRVGPLQKFTSPCELCILQDKAWSAIENRCLDLCQDIDLTTGRFVAMEPWACISTIEQCPFRPHSHTDMPSASPSRTTAIPSSFPSENPLFSSRSPSTRPTTITPTTSILTEIPSIIPTHKPTHAPTGSDHIPFPYIRKIDGVRSSHGCRPGFNWCHSMRLCYRHEDDRQCPPNVHSSGNLFFQSSSKTPSRPPPTPKLTPSASSSLPSSDQRHFGLTWNQFYPHRDLSFFRHMIPGYRILGSPNFQSECFFHGCPYGYYCASNQCLLMGVH